MTTPTCHVLDGIQPAALPFGARFRVLYPPVDPPMTESQQGWCVVTFTVVEAQSVVRRGEVQRMYRDDGWERVSADEAAGLWETGLGL
jgi:hypothetical protein